MHPLAGRPAPRSMLVSVPRLVSAYYETKPDPTQATERVAFGTSGHRGSAFNRSFNEDHIAAVSQAVCDYRQGQGITGPLYLGIDTHALSEPALQTSLSVLAANGVHVRVDATRGFTPTPVISHAIITWNRNLKPNDNRQADGIVITPSHNPPEDGGFKYNPPHGGPADTQVTKQIETQANKYLENKLQGVRRLPERAAWAAPNTEKHDYLTAYINDLSSIIDTDLLKNSKLKLAVDPLGGAAVAYWPRIAEHYNLDLTIVNEAVDPTFAFMRLDHDGKIRMDCSSPSAMASLVELSQNYDLAFGNDADVDRHGIVTPKAGLLNPNHYLAIAIDYLIKNRPNYDPTAKVGKTLVSSSLIDRVCEGAQRQVLEVPVGFKWFVPGLQTGQVFFGGEESAGASFLRKDGTTWTTDKDGIIMDLLAAEIRAKTNQDLQTYYQTLTAKYGTPHYARKDAPATPAQKQALSNLTPEKLGITALAGDPILTAQTKAPGNQAPIGGLKVTTKNGWFAARPSGTENVYKIYAESFLDESHLTRLQTEAQALVDQASKPQ